MTKGAVDGSMRQVELPFVISDCGEEDSIEDALGALDGVARNCV